MSKIAKFVASALNNSSTNEACTALKMAAATMQKEGVNPCSLLQHKGAANDSAELDDLRAQLERALAEITNARNRERYDSREARAQITALKGDINLLNAQIERLKANSNNADEAPKYRSELREAKELAIKWHKAASEKDAKITYLQRTGRANELILNALKSTITAREVEIRDLANVIAAAQERSNSFEERISKLKGLFFSGGIIACIFVGVNCYRMAENEAFARGYDSGKWAGIEQANKEARTKTKPALSKTVLDDGTATCFIQGKDWSDQTKHYVEMKFQYSNNVVTSFENGKKVGTDPEKNRGTFLANISKGWPGKSDCQLGVLK